MHRSVRYSLLAGILLLAAAPLAYGQTVVGRPVTDVYLREMRVRNRQFSGAQIEAYATKLKQQEQEFGVDDTRAEATRGIYMRLLEDSGRVDELLPLLEAEIARAKAQDKPVISADKLRLRMAQVLRVDGQTDKALAIYNELIAAAEKANGKNSPEALAKMQSLAEAQVMMQKPAAALELYQQIVERQEASCEKLSAVPFGYYVRVAQLHNDLGQTEAALTAFQEVAKKCPTVYGKNSIMETVYLSQCAQLLAALNRHAAAVELCERIVAQSVERDGDDHETTQNARIGLGGALQRLGKHDEAVEQYDMALAKLRAKLGDDPSRRLNAEKQIAAGYELAGRYAAAEPLHRNHLAVTERTTGKDSPATGSALAQLGLNLLQQEKWGDAEAALRPCLTIRQKVAADDWLTFSTMSMLGGALLGQKKYADAQPLLVDGVAGLEARAKQIPATGRVRYREAIERMVKLYQATNRPELAAQWSQKLQTLQAAVP